MLRKQKKIKLAGLWSNPTAYLKVNQQPRREKMKIEEKIKLFSPDEKIEVSNFTTMSRKCHWKCLKCNNEFDAIPNTIFDRHSKAICLKCNPPLRQREKRNRQDI